MLKENEKYVIWSNFSDAGFPNFEICYIKAYKHILNVWQFPQGN